MNFQDWQKQECARIGCTAEQHDRLIDISDRMAMAGVKGSYHLLSNIVAAYSSVTSRAEKMKDLGDLFNKKRPKKPKKKKRKGWR